MVEMIMVLPMLLFLIFGAVELSRAWFTLQAMTTAVREAARAGSVVAANNAIAVGQNRLDEVLAASGITPVSRNVTLPTSVPALPSGCGSVVNPCDSEVVATATVTFQTLFPVLIPQLQSINMTQTARMRFEGG